MENGRSAHSHCHVVSYITSSIEPLCDCNELVYCTTTKILKQNDWDKYSRPKTGEIKIAYVALQNVENVPCKLHAECVPRIIVLRRKIRLCNTKACY